MKRQVSSLTSVLVTFLGGGAMAPSTAIAQTKHVEVTVKAVDTRLSISFKNISHNRISTQQSQLPWGTWYSICLVAIAADVGEGIRLDARTPIDDPVPINVVIEPSRELHGSIDLPARFPKLMQELARNDVVILWYYGFKGSDSEETQAFTGSVILSKRSSVLPKRKLFVK